MILENEDGAFMFLEQPAMRVRDERSAIYFEFIDESSMVRLPDFDETIFIRRGYVPIGARPGDDGHWNDFATGCCCDG